MDAEIPPWTRLDRRLSLAQIADRVTSVNIDPKPRSGRQGMLENLVSRYL
jgi:xylose isomerase